MPNMSTSMTRTERLIQIRLAYQEAKPNVAENPAWANTHRDLRIVLGELNEAEMLLSRAMRLLDDWNAQYGEHQPKWLPPAGYVKLAEDYEEFRNDL